MNKPLVDVFRYHTLAKEIDATIVMRRRLEKKNYPFPPH